MFLMIAYVAVGLAGEVACATETLAGADRIEVKDVSTDADQASKKPVTVVDHCYTCVPLVMPPPVLVVEPTARSIPPTFATSTFVLETHPGLDTPPPKYRT